MAIAYLASAHSPRYSHKQAFTEAQLWPALSNRARADSLTSCGSWQSSFSSSEFSSMPASPELHALSDPASPKPLQLSCQGSQDSQRFSLPGSIESQRSSVPGSPESRLHCVGSADPIALFARHEAIVKTVKNGNWIEFVGKLSGVSAAPGTSGFRTSGSLLPPQGVGMKLFGDVDRGVAGIVFDRSAVDLKTAFMWPPGYMAKTEFNLTADGRLLSDRQKACVSLENLVSCNISKSYADPHSDKLITPRGGHLLPFNEVNFHVSSKHGIVALIVRSIENPHVIFALGVKTLVEHALGLHLPLLLCNGVEAVRHIRHEELMKAVLSAQSASRKLRTFSLPVLPLDLSALQALSDLEKLQAHGAVGLTTKSLTQTMAGVDLDLNKLSSLLCIGFRAAVLADNVPSARELVRASSRALLSASARRPHVPAGQSSQYTLQKLAKEISKMIDHSVGQPLSHQMLVPFGAFIVLWETCSGGVAARAKDEMLRLNDWLSQANSYAFLLHCWLHGEAGETGSMLSSLLNGDAAACIHAFHDQLQELVVVSHDLPVYATHLYEMACSLRNSPSTTCSSCLRGMFGLDQRFNAEVMYAVACLVLDIFSPCSRPHSPFDVAEAVYLEASSRRESVSGLSPTCSDSFNPDPLGELDRQLRVRYGALR